MPSSSLSEVLCTPVSVVVVNWNRKDLLRACLESLKQQQGVDFDVVVVDNGSTDGSPEVVQEFARSVRFPIKLLKNSENLGFCAANNQGIAATRGEFIALLNNDAEAEPGWLAALYGALNSRPEFGMAASKILVWEDPRIIDKAGHLIYPDGQNRGRGTGKFDQSEYNRLEEVLWPDGCAALYRRAMLEEIGGFDEDFFAYADDAELGLRARWAGWGAIYTPKAVVRHHRGATLGLGSARRLELIERNRILLVVKLFPWNLLCLNGLFYGARLAAGLMASLRNRGETRYFPGSRGKLTVAASLLKAAISAIPLMPRMIAKRRKVLRRMTPRQMRRLLLHYRIRLTELSEETA